MKILWSALIAIGLAACSGAGTPPPATAGDTAQATAERAARVAYLAAQLEQARKESHIPGMAVAVVQNDEVVFARGFGVSDLNTGAAVTPETVFAIGSTTKAFTATAIAMLVDAGAMSWDDPLSQYLPSLRLAVDADGDDAQPTVRDALCHRTGFPRMGVLWAANTLNRDEIFAYASRAEPTAQLGETFLYNNVTFMAAGEASARAVGRSWETLIRERLLAPLGMANTVLSTAAARDNSQLASGYSWFPDRGVHKREGLRELDAIAPAGSMYSTVIDMAQWVRFQLAEGVYGGKRLVSKAALGETRTTQIEVSGMGYGLGWFVRRWNEHTFVEHGGNIDGYAASVGFLPAAGVGYVLLTNISATPLQGSVGSTVFEALLTDAYQGKATASGEDFAPYLGKYIANFGPFNDARFVVKVNNNNLAVDVPGQTLYELKPPDEHGRRYFRMTDQIAVSFARADNRAGNRADNDDIVAMYLHQAGFDFELPREGVVPTVEVDAEQVAPLLGRYEDSDSGTVATVLIDRGRLAVDVPGQMRYQLLPPDEQGRRRLRVKRDYFAVFQNHDSQVATEFTLHQDDEQFVFARVADAGAAPVTVATVVALHSGAARKAAFAAMGTAVMEGSVHYPQAGITGDFTMYFAGTDRYREELDFGKVGRVVTVSNGNSAWVAGSFDDSEQLAGHQLQQARLRHPTALFGNWRDHFDQVDLVGTETRDGVEEHVVRLGVGDLPAVTIRVDATNGDIRQMDTVQVHPMAQIPVTMRFSDYRVVGGIRLPFKTVTEVAQSGQMIIAVDRIRTGIPAAADRFPAQLPPR